MRNAGTRRKETHVSPQADREARAAQGTFRGSQESHVETQGGGRGFGCECPGWGPREQHRPGRRGAGGTSRGPGDTHCTAFPRLRDTACAR